MNCFNCGTNLNGTEKHCPQCGRSTAPKIVHTIPVWAMVLMIVVVVLGIAAAVTLQGVTLARTATTAELTRATQLLVDDAAVTRAAIRTDGATTREALAAEADETRETVVSEATGVRDAITADGKTTREALAAAAQADSAAAVKIEQRLRSQGARLATFATRTDLNNLRPNVDLSTIATKDDLSAMEGRLTSQRPIEFRPAGDAVDQSGTVPATN